jgi:hypothetical protein
MKVDLNEEKEFTPIKISITLESIEETKVFVAMLNTCPANLKEQGYFTGDLKNMPKNLIQQILVDFWQNLGVSLKNKIFTL